MPNQLLDRLVVLWIMPPLGFLFTVLQVPELRYLDATYVLAAALLGAIAIRWHLRALPRRTVLLLLLATTLLATFMGMEWIHFLAGRRTIDDLTDLRIIVYSPFYGSILVFVLYAFYLTTLGDGQRKSHLGFVVRLMNLFHLFFLGYWLLLYLGWIEAIPKADLLHSNSVSYGALFVLCVMLFYRLASGVPRGMYEAFLVVNIAVIFVNQTRGALIALAAVLSYLLVNAISSHRRAVLTKLMLGAMLGLGIVVALADGTLVTRVLGKDADSLSVVLEQISDAYERKATYVEVSSEMVRDESSLSAFSRIGSNYHSFLSFLDNPLLGIGQAESYLIKILGAGVHSLHLLIANSTGLLGSVLYTAMLVAIMSAQGRIVVSWRLAAMLFLFFGYTLVFINSMPVYFALILTVLASQGVVSHRRVLVAESTKVLPDAGDRWPSRTVTTMKAVQ